MGNIIIPGQSALEQVDEITIEWTQDDVHPELAEDLELNSHLFPKYVDAVRNAVLRSIRHPDTKPLTITALLLKERVAMCHRSLEIMRLEMGMSLTHSFDKLGPKLLEALASGKRLEDLVEESRNRVREQGETWTRAAEPRLHVIHDDEDLAEGVTPDPEGDEE
jgi:hypothetical protein